MKTGKVYSIDSELVNSIINWDSISDEKVVECKHQLCSLTNLNFDGIGVFRQSGMVYVIIFENGGEYNKNQFLAIHTNKKQCKLVNDFYENAMRTTYWITFD